MLLKYIRKILAVSTLLLSCFNVGANVSLPQVNLGGSNFQDGLAKPNAWLFQETLTYFHAEDFNDAQGNPRLGDNSITSKVALTHFAYISDKKLLGGFYGAEVLLPYVNLDLDLQFGPTSRDTQMGDIKISPLMIQWMDKTLFGRPLIQRVAFSFTLPTGSYNNKRVLNVGNNYLTFNPYYSFTWLANKEWEISGRLHYLYNAENNDPSPVLNAQKSQAGQALHANFASSYALNDNWRIGFAGYYLTQFIDDKINGRSVANSKEKVVGFGPGLKYSNKGNFIYFNYFTESGAEDRTQGSKFSIRYAKVW